MWGTCPQRGQNHRTTDSAFAGSSCYSTQTHDYTTTGALTVHHHEQARLARRFLDRSYATPITIEQLSREVALSPYYLIRLFRRIYRRTPHQYLVGLRIAKAKELLSNSDLSITDICANVGFESLGSFSALFSKIVGISPSAYRRSSQTMRQSAYIPLCLCRTHSIDDTPDG